MNKALYIFVEVKENDTIMRGIIPVPSFLKRIIYVPDTDGNYMLLEQIILHNVEKLFSQSTIVSKTIIRSNKKCGYQSG